MSYKYFRVEATVVLFTLSWNLITCLMCLDPNANEVDWYATYKTATISGASDWRLETGMGHFYLDVNAPGEWVLNGQPINGSNQQIYNTLQQIYKPEGTLMYLMYNDERPDTLLTSSGGHTKGVVAFDETSGFWLVHSVPRFPPDQSEGYAWPNTGYGQTFLCVSLPYDTLGTVAKQLLYNQPHIYGSAAPDSFLEKFPTLKDVLDNKNPDGPPWYNIETLTSVGGQEFLSFAKANKFEADLYDALVAPTLKQNLLVETWLREDGGPLSSNCTAEYKVLRVDDISLPDGADFKETKDHAKWAVTTSLSSWQKQPSQLGFHNGQMKMSIKTEGDDWACVGDINRMESQFKRGGGTLCISHHDVWKAFTGTVANYTSCD